MAVFCDKTGQRLAPPNGHATEREDAKAYHVKRGHGVLCKELDPEDGWEPASPDEPAPAEREAMTAVADSLVPTPAPVADVIEAAAEAAAELAEVSEPQPVDDPEADNETTQESAE